MKRRRLVHSVVFNLNSLCENQLLNDFRFELLEMKKIHDVLYWNGVTSRNGCICEPLLACAILLFLLATTQRWYDFEINFGIIFAQINELFWEMLEKLVEKCGTRLELNSNQILLRAEIYANAISYGNSPFESSVGFIYWTKRR